MLAWSIWKSLLATRVGGSGLYETIVRDLEDQREEKRLQVENLGLEDYRVYHIILQIGGCTGNQVKE